MQAWEETHADLCSRQRDEGQFFGFKEVGEAHLERYTRFLFVPTVRDASEDAAEGKGTVLSDIMDLVVRSVLAQREDVKRLQEDTQKRYDEIMDPLRLAELQTLARDLSDTLKVYVPDASAHSTYNLDRPTAIFRNLQIPVYVVWDSDYGGEETKPEENHRLLRLFNQPIEDWPENVTSQFACFKRTLRDTLRTEIGQQLFDETFEACCERLCLGKKKDAYKNPMVIQEIIGEAQRQNKSSGTLNKIISQIVALRDSGA